MANPLPSRETRLREIIASYKGGKFTTSEIRLKSHCNDLLAILCAMAEKGEIKWCGKQKLKSAQVDIWQEIDLHAPQETTQRIKHQPPATDLPGWRKTFPELFCDPRLPGTRRIGHSAFLDRD